MMRRFPARLTMGAVLVLLVSLTALLSLVWTPCDATAIDVALRLQPPSARHLFGTDAFGRDVLSMVMVGARGAIGVAAGAALIGVAGGVPLGLLAAARPGWVDEMVMRSGDVVFAFPTVLLAVLLAAGFGPGATTTAAAIGIFNIPVFARLTRNGARLLWTRGFVLAARAAGAGPLGISLHHILPNLLGLLVIQSTIQLSVAILADAGLSYVGLGSQPPALSWGRMLEEAQTMTGMAPWLTIFPGIAVVVTLTGLSLLGDGLGTVLDPRHERRV
ncbi:MAG: ABC transporter permease [Telmatospirillum sp.]|nr:ABC transporter permease [Telmatospirillum sp.]